MQTLKKDESTAFHLVQPGAAMVGLDNKIAAIADVPDVAPGAAAQVELDEGEDVEVGDDEEEEER